MSFFPSYIFLHFLSFSYNPLLHYILQALTFHIFCHFCHLFCIARRACPKASEVLPKSGWLTGRSFPIYICCIIPSPFIPFFMSFFHLSSLCPSCLSSFTSFIHMAHSGSGLLSIGIFPALPAARKKAWKNVVSLLHAFNPLSARICPHIRPRIRRIPLISSFPSLPYLPPYLIIFLPFYFAF